MKDVITYRKGRATEFKSDCSYEGVCLTINHHGVSLYGWYDSIAGTDSIQISLDELEEAIRNARRKR